MIRYLQLPFYYDAGIMAQEAQGISRSWQLHFNKHDYDGSWSGLPLRSPGGKADNLFTESFNTGLGFEDTPLLDECPYIRSVIDSLACDKMSVRLLKLDQGAIVREHRDTGLNFEEGEVRIHVPVVTHPLVDFYLDGSRLNMQAGTCWYINAGLPHRLANHAPVDRIHLVIDCVVNDWVTALFAREDLPVRSIRDTREADRQQQLQLIEQLRLSGDPVRIRLADTLEQELDRP